jgi:hypothetical protein
MTPPCSSCVVSTLTDPSGRSFINRLVTFIDGATKTLDIEEEEFSDTGVENAFVSDFAGGAPAS